MQDGIKNINGPPVVTRLTIAQAAAAFLHAVFNENIRTIIDPAIFPTKTKHIY
jgi:hypothetical protein